MDPIKILKRAWHILWQYRALWIFGLILALTTAGSSGGSSNSGVRNNLDRNNQQYNQTMPLPDKLPQSINEAGEYLEKIINDGISSTPWLQNNWTSILWVVGIFILTMLVFGIIMTFLRYISETAVIRMVDEYEATDTKMSIRQGFRTGWSRTSWRLFLIDLLISLPMFLLFIGLLVLGFIIYTMIAGSSEPFAVAGVIGLIIIAVITIFVMVILGVVLDLLRSFFWRVCALENVGVMESLRRGFALVRQNWKKVGLMWLIMLGVSIIWMIVSVIGFIILIPVVLITVVIAAIVASVPGLLLVGVFSIFLSGPLPWIAAALFVLPLFATLAFSPWALLSAWYITFGSIVWTLTYREIKSLPALAARVELETLNQ